MTPKNDVDSHFKKRKFSRYSMKSLFRLIVIGTYKIGIIVPVDPITCISSIYFFLKGTVGIFG